MSEDWDEKVKPWKGREPKHPWGETLRAINWPECGDNTVSVEELYQAFKARLMAELVAEDQITHDSSRRLPLVDADVA